MDVKVLLVREAGSAVINNPKITLTAGHDPEWLEVTCPATDLPATAAELLRNTTLGVEVRLYLGGMCVARLSLRSWQHTGERVTIRAAVVPQDD